MDPNTRNLPGLPSSEVPTLRERMLAGGFWVAVTQIATQGVQFVVTAVLAHLLTPSDFGVLALCFVVIGTAAAFRELGLPSALVQTRELTPGQKNFAFWALMASAAALATTVFIAAPFLGILLGDEAVVPVLRVLAVAFPLISSGIVPAAILRRNLDFRSLGFADLGQVVGNTVVAIPVAFGGGGVWSLVFGFLGGSCVSTFLVFLYARWRPGFYFTKAAAKSLIPFGLNITGADLSYALRTYFDKYLVGRFLGTAALGGYSLAYRLITAPEQRVSWLVSRVTFPGFAAIQGNNEEIRLIYAKSLKLIGLVVIPALLGLLICAEEFVAVVYGGQWLFTVTAVRIMSLAGIFYAVGTTAGTIFLAKGRPDLGFKISLLNTALSIGALAVGIRFGLAGVASAVLVQASVGYTLALALAFRLINFEFGALTRALAAPLFATAALGAAAGSAKVIFAGNGVILRLLVIVTAGAAAYFITIWRTGLPELKQLKNFIRDRGYLARKDKRTPPVA